MRHLYTRQSFDDEKKKSIQIIEKKMYTLYESFKSQKTKKTRT